MGFAADIMTVRVAAVRKGSRRAMVMYEGFVAMPLGGRWRPGTSGKTAADTDPWNGAVLAEIPLASTADLDEAFTAATRAQQDWAAQPPARRAEVMLTAAALMQERKAEITGWLIRETGAPVGRAELEWSLTRSGMLRAAAVPHQVAGRIMPADLAGQESRVYRRPAGVVAVISPSRFPLQLANRSVGPALAAGNAVVLKPSSDAPVSGGLLLARIYEAAGLPPGLLNVVIGAGDVIGDAMARHPLGQVVSFCGAAATGRGLARQAGLKRLVLGFGGPGPLVVLADADLGRAVDAALFGSVVRPGQVCLMATRLAVDRKVYHEFTERLVTAASSLRAGDPAAADTDVGPVINARQLSLAQSRLEQARAGGARQVLGGEPGGPAGLVLPPHVLLARSDLAAAREEPCGPVITVIRARDEQDALEIADDTPDGRPGAVFTGDAERGVRFALRARGRMTYVNDSPAHDDAGTAFGGLASRAVEEFTTEHWVSVRHAPGQDPR